MMKIITTFLSVIICSASFGLTLKGKVVDRKNIVSGASIQLLDSNGFCADSQLTDINGKFLFKNVTPGNYAIKVRYVIDRDTIYKNISIAEDIKLTLDIREFCKYDATIKNSTCPECHKHDEVIPIVYGLRLALNGKDPMENEGKTWKSAGCVITNCDPHWYCKRDKIEF